MIWPIISAAAALALSSNPSQPVHSCPQATDGNTIARVQSAAEDLIERLRSNPTYGGAWFEYVPCYRVVLAFTDDRPRPRVIEAAPEHLRPYIGFGRTSFSEADRDSARRQIWASLGERRIEAVLFAGDPRQPIRIGVKTEADAVIARSLIPERYRALALVVPGGYAEPIPESSLREQLNPPVAPGEYVGPSAAEEREMSSRRESLQGAELQLFVIPFNRQVRALPGFSDLYIEHEPSWHVVVAFTSPPPLEEVKALAPALIRDRIVIRRAERTQAQINGDLEAIAEAFRGGGFDFTGGYDPKRQLFDFTVGTETDRQRALGLIPSRLRADTQIKVGPLPVPE